MLMIQSCGSLGLNQDLDTISQSSRDSRLSNGSSNLSNCSLFKGSNGSLNSNNSNSSNGSNLSISSNSSFISEEEEAIRRSRLLTERSLEDDQVPILLGSSKEDFFNNSAMEIALSTGSVLKKEGSPNTNMVLDLFEKSNEKWEFIHLISENDTRRSHFEYNLLGSRFSYIANFRSDKDSGSVVDVYDEKNDLKTEWDNCLKVYLKGTDKNVDSFLKLKIPNVDGSSYSQSDQSFRISSVYEFIGNKDGYKLAKPTGITTENTPEATKAHMTTLPTKSPLKNGMFNFDFKDKNLRKKQSSESVSYKSLKVKSIKDRKFLVIKLENTENGDIMYLKSTNSNVVNSFENSKNIKPSDIFAKYQEKKSTKGSLLNRFSRSKSQEFKICENEPVLRRAHSLPNLSKSSTFEKENNEIVRSYSTPNLRDSRNDIKMETSL